MTVVWADPAGFAVDWNWQRHLTMWTPAGRPSEPRFDSQVLEHELPDLCCLTCTDVKKAGFALGRPMGL
jgi:hypothetical protein